MEDRLRAELQLLESMYPTQVTFNSRSRELRYTESTSHIIIRLPPGYLVDDLPQIIEAQIGHKDARDEIQELLSHREPGEEILDWIILNFQELFHAAEARVEETNQSTQSQPAESIGETTVVIWLHHLLNTEKRKQALSPASAKVSGVSKPGYPGVLVFTGPKDEVEDHVKSLKQLKWQAFQVRLTCDEEWKLEHGSGVVEVETMKDIVMEVGDNKKADFMAAMRMS